MTVSRHFELVEKSPFDWIFLEIDLSTMVEVTVGVGGDGIWLRGQNRFPSFTAVLPSFRLEQSETEKSLDNSSFRACREIHLTEKSSLTKIQKLRSKK